MWRSVAWRHQKRLCSRLPCPRLVPSRHLFIHATEYGKEIWRAQRRLGSVFLPYLHWCTANSQRKWLGRSLSLPASARSLQRRQNKWTHNYNEVLGPLSLQLTIWESGYYYFMQLSYPVLFFLRLEKVKYLEIWFRHKTSKIMTFSFLGSNSFWLFLRQFTTCVWQRAEESCFIIQQLPAKSVCHLARSRRAAITTNNHGNSTTLHSTMRSSTGMRSTGQMCPQHRK